MGIHDDSIRRFTPTGVGTISSSVAGGETTTVHPHGRGDNRNVSVISTGSRGSPPRAWGQSDTARAACSSARFTPTGVGTMALNWSSVKLYPVHPHGRGDNARAMPSSPALRGSPPRAWGQFLPRPTRARNRRFTPTGVGTIRRLLYQRAAPPVHPHGRGDNSPYAHLVKPANGSPPRAWGQCANCKG